MANTSPSGDSSDTNIYIDNIHKGVHKSDTGVYDAAGNVDPVKFQSLFERFDSNKSGALNEIEIDVMIDANVNERPGGRTATEGEFGLLLDVGSDRTDNVNGKKVRAISRERLIKFYGGELFFELIGLTPPWQ